MVGNELYNACIKFYLVQNLTVNLKPLEVFNETSLLPYNHAEVREVIGWDSINLITERDRDTHGFKATVSADSLVFRCNTGQEFLETIEGNEGSDANVKLVVTENGKVVGVTQLDFSDFNRTVEGLEVSLEDAQFDGLLVTRQDVQYPITLDDDLYLYSAQREEFSSWGHFTEAYQWLFERPDFSLGGYEGVGNYHMYPFANRTKAEIEQNFQYPAQIHTRYDSFAGALRNALMPIRPNKPVKVKVSIDVGVVCYFRDFIPDRYDTGAPDSTDQVPLELKIQYPDPVGTGLETVTLLPTSEHRINHYDTLGKGPVNSQTPGEVEATLLRFTWEEEMILGPGVGFLQIWFETVHLYGNQSQAVSPPQYWEAIENQNMAMYDVTSAVDLDTGEVVQIGNDLDDIITVSGDVVEDSSITKSKRLIDVFNEVSGQMLGYPGQGMVLSDVLSAGGEGGKIQLTKGHAIRNAESPMEYSATFMDLWKGAKPLMGLGYNVEFQGDGTEKIKLEYADHFYKKEVVSAYLLGEVAEYSEGPDMSRVFNQVSSGYSKFSKDRETNKKMTRFDTHGRQEYLTPIKKEKNEVAFISEFIASQYTLEDVRLKQFDTDATDSSVSEDDSNFMVTVLGDNGGKKSSLFYTTGEFEPIEDSSGKVIGVNILDTGMVPVVAGDNIVVVVTAPPDFIPVPIPGVVSSVEYQPISLLSENYNVSIYYTSELPAFNNLDTATGIELQFPERFVPESDEPFDTVGGTQNKNNAYNLRFTPKRMLLNNHREVNVGLIKKLEADEITVQKIEGNSEVETQLKVSDPFNHGDVDRKLVDEDGPEVLSEFGDREYLHQPYMVNVTFENISYEMYTRFLLAHKTDTSYSYGEICVNSPLGDVIYGFLDKCVYSPGSGTMELTLLLTRKEIGAQKKIMFDLEGNYIFDNQGNYIILTLE